MVKDVLSLVGIVISAVLPVIFGINLFARQKQHELIVERYLHQGLDELYGHCQHIINVHIYNWSLCMDKLKLFRDAPEMINSEEIYAGYEKLRSDAFPFSAGSRVNALTNSVALWEAYQLILAFGSRSYSFCALESPMVIKAALDKKLTGKNDEIYGETLARLKRLEKECETMLNLMGLISKVSLIFETSKLNFRTVFNIHKNKQVVNAISALNQEIILISPKSE